jgi:peroxiredoxin Q/BCP
LSSLRDDFEKFRAKSAAVYGVNNAGASKHKEYCDSFQFPFPLLSDPDLAVTRAYGSLNDKGTGVGRSVCVIGRDGKVAWAQAGMPSDEEILSHLA